MCPNYDYPEFDILPGLTFVAAQAEGDVQISSGFAGVVEYAVEAGETAPLRVGAIYRCRKVQSDTITVGDELTLDAAASGSTSLRLSKASTGQTVYALALEDAGNTADLVLAKFLLPPYGVA